MLDAGSSRVFNCNDRARALLEQGSADPYFFRSPKLHGIVLIKEVVLDSTQQQRPSKIGTKAYLPYNQANVYEGGRSIFLSDRQLLSVLNEVLGLGDARRDAPAIGHDLEILRILDELPTLDGFLMRDALELEGISPNEAYFEVSDSERTAIHEFIRGRFEPLVRAAFGGGAMLAGRVSHLIDKIWEANDKEALKSLIEAFHFPDDEALSIFAAWKGIIFYTFEYSRTREGRDDFGLWLRDGAVPTYVTRRSDREYFDEQRKAIIAQLREHWGIVDDIARKYEGLYDRFVSDRDGVGAFLHFLRQAHEIYWTMGNSLSRINHAIFCWRTLTNSFTGRRLPADKLAYLFNVLRGILMTAEGTPGKAQSADVGALPI